MVEKSKNLKPIRSVDEARENGKKGGKKMVKKTENLKPFTSNQSREEAVKNGKKVGLSA